MTHGSHFEQYRNQHKEKGFTGEYLWGWDDESILYQDAAGVEHTIQDHPELMQQILELCRQHFSVRQGN